MTAQGPELRELADTLREAGGMATEGPWSTDRGGYDDDWPIKGAADYLCASPDDGVRGGHSAADAALIVLLRNNLPTIISALERAAAAEGEKAEMRAGAAELMADELESGTVVALWEANRAADPYQAVRDVVQNYCHDWAAKFRGGAS